MAEKSLEIGLGERSYQIEIGRSLEERILEKVHQLRSENRGMVFIVDDRVASLQSGFCDRIRADAPMILIPSGEPSKSFMQVERCCEFLADRRLDRSSVVFAVGGGVTGDLAGYVAASYLRGISFYQIPTTLLAMVDSSVGGKTGVNLSAGKNLVGAFHQPVGVFADLDLLKTLPAPEFSAGMAEVIKAGMLADRALFEKLEALDRPLDPEHPRLAEVIYRSCQIKLEVVEADEREQAVSGGRALLNLGHTFAHAIEAVAGYGEYLHGEAVAIGLVLASRLSESLGLVDASVVSRVETLLRQYALPIALRAPLSVRSLTETMARDKKVRQGVLKFVVIDSLGQARTRGGVPTDLVESIWRTAGAE